MKRFALILALVSVLGTAASADIIVSKKQVYGFIRDTQAKNNAFKKKNDGIIKHMIRAFSEFKDDDGNFNFGK